ncbi:glycosyltransferase [Butyrivibrio sp. VCD2006]|uniref:glycosyltransferase n=1 Tax=Butyrivibrio sp. VCD2006 TaxID=1280664 RepID=UPI0012DBFC8B|nr:glycosyltransferase [Butyrivibrio sp. VCD2006]
MTGQLQRWENEIKMEPVEISVIMGVYNERTRDDLDHAVNSILGQTFKNFEFIIYDDGSDWEVSEKIKALHRKDKRIVPIGSEENHGLAFSLNECLKRTRGRYIARMDVDDISLPKRLDKQYKFLEEHKEYDWCGTNAKVFDSAGIWGQTTRPEIPTAKDYLRYSPYIHPTVMYRREILMESGGYAAREETLRCEDYEIFMRLFRQGGKGYNIQEDLFLYHVERESYHVRSFKFRLYEARIRYQNFKEMGLLFPFGWVHCLRPFISLFVPVKVVEFVKNMRKSL